MKTQTISHTQKIIYFHVYQFVTAIEPTKYTKKQTVSIKKQSLKQLLNGPIIRIGIEKEQLKQSPIQLPFKASELPATFSQQV